MKATSLPQPSTWPVLSVFRILGFFFSIVLHEVGARKSQPLAGTLLSPRKPFHRRMGPQAHSVGMLSPWQLFWLLAVQNSPPHTTAAWLTAALRKFKPRCWHCEKNRVRMQHSGTQQHINQKPCAVSEMLFREHFDEIGSCKYMMILKRIRRVCP